jgi:O-succinylbenzoic acid--CoA ligase
MSYDIFERARQRPEVTALVTGAREWSYAELAASCARAAGLLARDGLLTSGSPVALVTHPNPETLATLLAAIAYGVPLLLVGPRVPESERAALIARAGARACLVATPELLATAEAPPPPACAPAPETPLAIVPSSGSTGQPKLVVLSRAAFAASAAASAQNLPLTASDRWFLCLPLAHVGGLSIVTRSLSAGSAIALFDSGPGGLVQRARELGVALERARATLVSLVPTLLSALLELEPPWSPPASLRGVLLGGAATSPELLSRAGERGVTALVTYGLTEACSQVTTTPSGTRPRIDGGLVSAGRPLPGVELAIDANDRILVRGPVLASALLDAALPLDREGWLVTDDLGRLDADGELFVFGRGSDRIVSGGDNVDPLRVEAVLLATPGVLEACVFPVADATYGELVACALVVAPEFDAELTRRSLERELAPSARPRRVAVLLRLPQTGPGKLDRRGARVLATPLLETWTALNARRAETPT